MRRDIIIGLLVSTLLHGGFLYGLNRKPPPRRVAEEKVHLIRMEMPPLEPEKPDKIEDLPDELPPNVIAPPTLVDLPTVVPINAITQPLQPPPPPGPTLTGTVTIPVSRPTSFSQMKDLFDLANLDKIPEATVQIKPQYPFEMRRAGITGEVTVGFIVTSSGEVVEAYVVKSSQREFEAPAVLAVSRWKFRPGRKGGRAVNTRMLVPIVFSITDEE